MALTAVDRALLQRCLSREPGAWNDFVDRYLGLIYHVIHYTSYLRSTPLTSEDVEDMAAEVLLQVVEGDYAVLRQFRGQSSLATYLTVIARRICVTELSKRAGRPDPARTRAAEREPDDRPTGQASLERLEEVAKLLRRLPASEREVVRMRFLEGRSYEEISTALNIPVNSIGSILARAKKRLRGEDGSAAKPTTPKASASKAPEKPSPSSE